MNKTEFTQRVAAASGLSQKEASLGVNAVLHVVTTAMQQCEKVQLPGFGSFTVRERPARMGRNPLTGASIRISAKKVVKFTPGSGLSLASKPGLKPGAKPGAKTAKKKK